MREITNHRSGVGMDELVRIEIADDPNPETKVSSKYQFFLRKFNEWGKAARIEFQNGPLSEIPNEGPNGVSTEALLAVAIDRLQGFQSSKFSCRENAIALTHLETALLWLQARTRTRIERGVEGKLVP